METVLAVFRLPLSTGLPMSGVYTNARFAQSAARIAKLSASWAGDIGDADLTAEANPDSVCRYLTAMRDRLDIIEQWEAENRPLPRPIQEKRDE